VRGVNLLFGLFEQEFVCSQGSLGSLTDCDQDLLSDHIGDITGCEQTLSGGAIAGVDLYPPLLIEVNDILYDLSLGL
jgi:hypothetical protein